MKIINRKLQFVLLLIFIATGCQANRLAIVDYELPLSSKNSKAPITIVQISDLHFKPGKNLNDQVVRAIQEIKPDLIFFTGDMIDNKDNMAAFSDYIDAFPKSPHMYAILGNWEYWSHIDFRELEKIYSANGIRLLVNEESIFNVDSISVRVIGLDDLLGGKPSFTTIDNYDDQVIIVLAHCPQLYELTHDVIPQTAKGLVLSGQFISQR
jgi:predicted MPP superfamily phosphohydrolase